MGFLICGVTLAVIIALAGFLTFYENKSKIKAKIVEEKLFSPLSGAFSLIAVMTLVLFFIGGIKYLLHQKVDTFYDYKVDVIAMAEEHNAEIKKVEPYKGLFSSSIYEDKLVHRYCDATSKFWGYTEDREGTWILYQTVNEDAEALSAEVTRD